MKNIALIAFPILVSPAVLAQAPLFELQGGAPPLTSFGWSLDVGDVDADGFADLIVGTTSFTGVDLAGRVQVWSGRTQSLLYEVRGGDNVSIDTPMPRAAIIGDITGDGRPDLAVAWWNFGMPVLYGFDGATGHILGSFDPFHPTDVNDIVIAPAGDLDQDGRGDFFVGDHSEANGFGAVWIFSGAHGLIDAVFGSNQARWFGTAVVSLGDFDHDGTSDFAVGAPGGNLQNSGAVKILSGATRAELLTIPNPYGAATLGSFGARLAKAGDVDHDGTPDVLVATPGYSVGLHKQGRVDLFSGATGAVLHSWIGAAAGDYLGTSIDGGADVDGDGTNDVAIGVTAGFNSPKGRVIIASGASGAILFQVDGDAAGAALGLIVRFAGDLNQDGHADFAASAVGDTTGGTFSGWAAGAVEVFLGGVPAPASYCTAKLTSQNCLPVIASSGSPSVAFGDDLLVSTSKVVPQQPGALMWSLAPANLPFGGGTLCVAQPARFSPTLNSGGVGPCTGVYQFAFTKPFLASHGLSAGLTVFMQMLSRDPGFAPGAQVGLSDGLRVVLAP
jgi:hypothetical protein